MVKNLQYFRSHLEDKKKLFCSHSVVRSIITASRAVDSGSNPDGSTFLFKKLKLNKLKCLSILKNECKKGRSAGLAKREWDTLH